MTTEIVGYVINGEPSPLVKEARNKYLREKKYYRRQRAVGILLMMLSLFSIWFLENAAVCIFMFPIGVVTTISKEKLLTERPKKLHR